VSLAIGKDGGVYRREHDPPAVIKQVEACQPELTAK
jgi:hypothetical protein